jgi:hypothetical protein
MAGASTLVSGRRPKRWESATQADGTPGTITGSQPKRGTSVNPRSSKASSDMPFGDGPLAFSPCNPPFAHTKANASPPMPLEVGSTTVRAAAVAIAASTAFPPCCMIVIPACAAIGCEVATIPFFAHTGRRGRLYGFRYESKHSMTDPPSCQAQI